MGKVLLAFLPAPSATPLLDDMQLAQRGPNTLTERRALEAELDRVRERGLALNNEELAYGLRSIAAPVRSSTGDVAAAINLAVHSSMVSMEDLVARLGGSLKDAPRRRSPAQVGYRPGDD